MTLDRDPAAAACGLVEGVDRGHVRERVLVRDDLRLAPCADATGEVLDLEAVLVVPRHLDERPGAGRVLELDGALTQNVLTVLKLLAISACRPSPKSSSPANSSSMPSGPSDMLAETATGSAPIVQRLALRQ